jgi:hypothetical protein
MEEGLRTGAASVERFNVLLVRPAQFIHHHAYTGVATLLRSALRRLGYPTRVAENEMIYDATNIVLGAQYLEPEVADSLPANTIIYNTEMVVSYSPFLETLIPFVGRFETWDYSEKNVRAWRERGISERVHWLRPGYVPECTTVDPRTPTDLDAIFYGHMNTRRREVLDRLAELGVRVQLLQNTYGPQRDAYIARARLVLNIHSRPDSLLEIARVSQVLSNHRVLVSERGDDTEVSDLREGIAFADAEELPQLCRALLDDEPRRATLAEKGFELYRRRDFVATMRELLAARGGLGGD